MKYFVYINFDHFGRENMSNFAHNLLREKQLSPKLQNDTLKFTLFLFYRDVHTYIEKIYTILFKIEVYRLIAIAVKIHTSLSIKRLHEVYIADMYVAYDRHFCDCYRDNIFLRFPFLHFRTLPNFAAI